MLNYSPPSFKSPAPNDLKPAEENLISRDFLLMFDKRRYHSE